jgi:hypothetical protein
MVGLATNPEKCGPKSKTALKYGAGFVNAEKLLLIVGHAKQSIRAPTIGMRTSVSMSYVIPGAFSS